MPPPQKSLTYEQFAAPRSDGNVSTHPTNTTQPNTHPSQPWEYFRPVERDEHKDLVWRSKTASAAALAYTKTPQPPCNTFICDFPAGYRLFEHIKHKPDGAKRTDTYLFGHPSGGRFRSTNEFIPHLIHLFAIDPANQSPLVESHKICPCCLCKTGAKESRTPARTPSRVADIPPEQAWNEAATLERVGEQETPGWILRKGEVVWVWTGTVDALENPVDNVESPSWAAGIIFSRPSLSPVPKLRPVPRANAGSFADVEMNDAPTWEDGGEDKKKNGYVIVLCAEKEPKERLDGVPQHCIMPWLARPDFIQPPAAGSRRKEHPSVAWARKACSTFSYFDPTGEKRLYPSGQDKTEMATFYNGLFIGAEKIFIGEPVRVKKGDNSDEEDVLLVEFIYVVNHTDQLTGKPVESVHVAGNLYGDPTRHKKGELTPEEWIVLPLRMRIAIDPETRAPCRWCKVSRTAQRSELSIHHILGRWYEPHAVIQWRQPEDPTLEAKEVSSRAISRSNALGWTMDNTLVILNPEDRNKPQPGRLVFPSVIPTKRKASERVPGSAEKSRMARAAAEDAETDQEEEEEASPAPIEGTTVKKLAIR